MLGLYLHIPFCLGKCPYCDFFSVAGDSPHLAGYPALLQRHLELAAGDGWTGPFDTVYFGGGTPSLLAPAVIGALLEAVAARFGLTADAEITLEANPGTVTGTSLAGYRAAGVNRLSLGLQRLDDDGLRLLGRRHTASLGAQAVALARAAGFINFSIDLIFALPGETLAGLAAELDRYLELAPEHLSCYGLTAEPGTPLQARVAAGDLELPDGEYYADAFLYLHGRLEAAGYRHYEIANYARPGRECRHNLGYWRRQPYLGIGAGAHSFRDRGWGGRREVPADLARYATIVGVGGDPSEVLEFFDRATAMGETLYLGLRTAEGVDDAAFRACFGCGVEEAFPQVVARLSPWLQLKEGCWKMSVEGWLLYDRLVQEFL